MTIPSLIENKEIPIVWLEPHPKNYRIHPENQINQLRASYREYGQFRSIVAVPKDHQNYLIIAGHGMVEAMKREGVATVRVDVLPENTPDKTLQAIMIADNRTSNAAKDDEYILLELLKEQNNLGADPSSLGLYEGELDDLMAKLTPPTLEQLAEIYGNEPKEEDFWPVVKVKVPPAVKDRYDAITPQVRDEAQKFTHLLNLAEEKEKAAFDNDMGMLHIPASSTTQRLYKKLLEKAEGTGEKEQFAYLLKQIAEVLV